MKTVRKTFFALVCFLMFPALTHADVITFNFTGGLVVADQNGYILVNGSSPVTPIAASLTYDTVTGLGSSGLSLTMSDDGFWQDVAVFHDINIYQSGVNQLTGEILVDWAGSYDMPLHIDWDATGLFNAINYGLQAGDVISGTRLYRDANGNEVEDAGEFLADVYSATPYSDILQTNPNNQGINVSLQGAAPMAAMSSSLGLTAGPFPGIRGYFDIGSGNSMHVTEVQTVPVPAAAWLFLSGLAGLLGVSRRRRAAKSG